MTNLAANAKSPPAAPNGSAPARSGRRHGIRPGVSLLAQGEPMVWLTGGAFVLAVCMIMAFLALVLVAGGSTFWTIPVERVRLADGTEVVGEVARSESYFLTRALLERLSGQAATNAQRLLGDREQVAVQRHMYRVGNYELTQEHYVWVADYELASDAPPEFDPWMIALERVEWGRFFGTLEAYHQVHHRPTDSQEDDLRRSVDFLEAQLTRLSDDEQAKLADALAKLRKSLDDHRRKRTIEFVRATCGAWPTPTDSTPSDVRWEIVLDDDTSAPLEASAPLERVRGVREIHADPPTAWSKFRQHEPAVRRRAREIERVTKHDVGRLGDAVEKARLAIRAVELDSGETFVDRAVELANLREELAAGDAELARLGEVATLLKRHPTDGADLVGAAKTIVGQLRDEFTQQTTSSRERQEALEAELAKQSDALKSAVENYLDIRTDVASRNVSAQQAIALLERENAGHQLVLRPTGSEPVPISVAVIVRAYPANQLSWTDKVSIYLSRWWEFLSDVPREANSEGGVFPAIFGTVAMTLVMSLAVVPFGVLAALYLREYARGGLIVSILRIAINNLAGVPSIVFGVFGLGFFCYLMGAYLDGGPANAGITPLTPYGWYFGLAGLAIVGTSAFLVGIASSRTTNSARRWTSWLGRIAMLLWIGTTLTLVFLIFVTPFFDGFFAANLPNPTLGKGGLLWSSLTLALMTLPVVIVATEEALSAVPNSMREGSYACGAGKWQTIRRIVLPQALPGIMTGMILAMARGAGEVAPLMLVGAVKVAPELPIDTTFPFLHPERSYLHLGFHIFDLGFQSQNSEAAKPMVFTTTLLLIVLIASLNITAVWLRARLRKRFRSVQF